MPATTLYIYIPSFSVYLSDESTEIDIYGPLYLRLELNTKIQKKEKSSREIKNKVQVLASWDASSTAYTFFSILSM